MHETVRDWKTFRKSKEQKKKQKVGHLDACCTSLSLQQLLLLLYEIEYTKLIYEIEWWPILGENVISNLCNYSPQKGMFFNNLLLD